MDSSCIHDYYTDSNYFKLILLFLQIYFIHIVFIYIFLIRKFRIKQYTIGSQTENNDTNDTNDNNIKETCHENTNTDDINDFLYKLKKTYILSLKNIKHLTNDIRYEKGVQIYTDDCINNNIINIISSSISNDALIYNVKVNMYHCIIHIHRDKIKTICNCQDYKYRMSWDNNMTCKHCTSFLLKLYKEGTSKGTSCPP
jgi:hypothetical protein